MLQAVCEGQEQLPSPAWQLAWNCFGTWLAASLAEQPLVQLWRKNLLGEWALVARAAGAPDAAAQMVS